MADSCDEFILVAAQNRAGEHFIKALQRKEIPFCVVVNNKRKQEEMEQLRVKHIIVVDTVEHDKWVLPEYSIGKVYLFEDSLPLCCRFIQICRSWTTKSIYVISHRGNPRMIYRGLGANHILLTNSEDVSFLIDEEGSDKG